MAEQIEMTESEIRNIASLYTCEDVADREIEFIKAVAWQAQNKAINAYIAKHGEPSVPPSIKYPENPHKSDCMPDGLFQQGFDLALAEVRRLNPES